MGCSSCGGNKVPRTVYASGIAVAHKFVDIGEGVIKAAVGAEEELYQSRIAICNTCEHLEMHGLGCGKCHCILTAKLRVKRQYCPINKWQAV